MKRITFVKLIASTTASLCLPDLGCKSKDAALASMLSQPNALQHICDAQTIREIGNAYQKLVPNEDNKETLVKLLAANIHDPIDKSAHRAFISSTLDKKVQQDFQENKTIVADGWVLSLTEARQCALFSLIQN